ncbi:hypothetical protein Ciccas_005216 [Cichlidogyrus casuarinus]|uniref:Matrix-remodeling-associated protein 7 helical domain-containing protein n=1 Tax=Cichlidogyrus casuarinus TaxID=1844966 RepID=A0ABD2Q9B1_9PLAT
MHQRINTRSHAPKLEKQLLSLNDLEEKEKAAPATETPVMMCPFMAAFRAAKLKELSQKEATEQNVAASENADKRLKSTIATITQHVQRQEPLHPTLARNLKANMKSHYPKEEQQEDEEERIIRQRQMEEIFELLSNNPDMYGMQSKEQLNHQLTSLYAS